MQPFTSRAVEAFVCGDFNKTLSKLCDAEKFKFPLGKTTSVLVHRKTCVFT